MSYEMCPHCRRIASDHSSFFPKEIGKPIVLCKNCGKPVVDNNVYEWSAIPKSSQIFYCLFSNNRAMIQWFAMILPMSVMVDNFLLGLLATVVVEAILGAVLYFCVISYNDDEIVKSAYRVKDPEYIDELAELGYFRLNAQLYNEYLDRRNNKSKQHSLETNPIAPQNNCSLPSSVPTSAVNRVAVPPRPEPNLHFDPVSKLPEKEVNSSEKYQLALNRWKNRKKDEWDIGVEYERYIGYRLECEGFKVQYIGATQGKNDMGRDLIAIKKGVSLVIQCKRWSKEKTIHEKHIFQLHGSTAVLSAQNPGNTYKAVFITTATLSETAKKCAEICNVTVVERLPMADYPMIKCNFNKDGEKIYHLPFDPQYDKIVISKNKKSCYVWTTKEAEDLGFRHTYHWRPNKS